MSGCYQIYVAQVKLFMRYIIELVRNWNILGYANVNSSSVYQFKRCLQGMHFYGKGSVYCFN